MFKYKRIWKAFVLTMRDMSFAIFATSLIIGIIMLIIKVFGPFALAVTYITFIPAVLIYVFHYHNSK